MALAGVVFDYSVLLGQQPATVAGLKTLLGNIRAAGLKIVVLSTHRQDINGKLASRGCPMPIMALPRAHKERRRRRDEVAISKGSPLWMFRAAEVDRLRAPPVVNIGDEHCDWTGAIRRPSCTCMPWSCQKPGTSDLQLRNRRSAVDVHHALPADASASNSRSTCPERRRSISARSTPPTATARCLRPARPRSICQYLRRRQQDPVKVGPVPGGDLMMVHTPDQPI